MEIGTSIVSTEEYFLLKEFRDRLMSDESLCVSRWDYNGSFSYLTNNEVVKEMVALYNDVRFSDSEKAAKIKGLEKQIRVLGVENNKWHPTPKTPITPVKSKGWWFWSYLIGFIAGSIAGSIATYIILSGL